MRPKNSRILDLRKPQSELRDDRKSVEKSNYDTDDLGEIGNFNIPLIGEDLDLNVDANKILTFDLPLDSYSLESKVELDSQTLYSKKLKIEFIPKSAKIYSYNNYINTIKKYFIIDSQKIYLARASFGVFMSLCLILTMVIPSMLMFNGALRVKDELLLKASASEKLLLSTNKDSLKSLSSSLVEIANSIEGSSRKISNLQGGFESIFSFVPGLSVIQDSSELGDNIANVVSVTGELSTAIEPFITKEINPFDKSKQITLVDGVKKIKEVNQKLIPALDDLSYSLDKLPINLIPGSKGALLRQLQKDIPNLKQAIIDSEPYLDVFLNFVGSDMLKRYVFIFQNNQEIRATGGFIGSFGMMDIDRGVVKSLDIKEIYNPDGQLSKKILAPAPLQELTTRWYLRDSNWFADFPTSAKKITSFYEQTGGATPDGVISLTPTVIERLLLITGPITLDNYGVTINADNFIKITQYQTGVAYDKVQNKPKQFIADLAPILINKLLSSDVSQYQKILEVLNNSFQEKHILLYFIDPQLQDIVNKYGLGGKLYDAPKDYLSVVHSNIGGYKTDGVMQESIDISTKLQDNKKIINKVTVSREHKGGGTEFEWWNKDNINYMRVYLPKGVRILNVSGYNDKEAKQNLQGVAGYAQDQDLKSINENLSHNEDWDIDIFEESNKTVIGGWVITSPRETSKIVLEYELPFEINSSDIYSLILQKQAGTLGVKYKYNLELPNNKKSIWKQSSFELNKTDSGYKLDDGILRTDEYVALQIN